MADGEDDLGGANSSDGTGNGGGNSEPESSDSLKAFGEVVKAFRKRAGLTQEEFAPQVRYSPQTVASIEQGRRFPPPEFVERAEEVLDAFGALRGRRGICRGSRGWRVGSGSGRGWRRRRSASTRTNAG